MITNAKLIHLQQQHFWLLPQKAAYWQEKNILLVSDLHLGKSGHFRKQGIPVPGQINTSNIALMGSLIRKLNPQHLVVLGDLFHSKINREWNAFRQWRQKYRNLKVSLIIGNHDILPGEQYDLSDINVYKQLFLAPFILVHDIQDFSRVGDRRDNYPLSGHVHPAVRLTGKGRQTLKLPCFYFGVNYGILPAFGEFTGSHTISPKQGERIFAVAEGQVVEVSRPQ